VAVLRAQQVHTPCLMWGANAIQVAYQLGCRSIPTFSSGARPDADEADIVAAAQAGEAVVVKLRADVEAPVFLSGWQRVAVPATEYVLYVDVPNADVAGGR
jgi:hypothetical protein